MRKALIYSLIAVTAWAANSCKDVDYDWEQFKIAATPKVTINIEKSALPTYQTANVSFFNMATPDYATAQEFEWTLDYYDADGRVHAQSIDVYISFNRRESSPPTYPITLSLAGVWPNIRQFPLPSTIRSTDMLYETVTEFPKTFSHTPAELAEIVGIDLDTVEPNDYFLFKFAITMTDGTRLVQFQDNACDESRGEPCDCRTGVRFKNL
ncbi:hypothetical protein JHJ32_17060 [Parapedobacter sp. ISTM3]|uniref:Uncharacterized protein n=1 Tax=Parapedobacter luteus TaxID=623280 RepID=A0A1T5AL28_9SPHI|nr:MULTISPECIES: hypothetical protein [Parapedobacter]MBK1441712.1 hypothetical protein [Parapedobacter sp. ISTM3]SKB35550.1 hypothetical protein SAMN05660226_00860 [Parapedobacter luteus]